MALKYTYAIGNTPIFARNTMYGPDDKPVLTEGTLQVNTNNVLTSLQVGDRVITIIPEPPASGEFVLTAKDGVLSWEPKTTTATATN